MRILKRRKSIPPDARLALRSAVYRLSWQVAIVVMILAAPSAGRDAASQIRAEAERLQQSLKDKPISYPDIPNASTMHGDGLKEVVQGQSAGRLYISLETLGQMTDFLYGVRAATDNAEAVQSGFPAYEAEWEKVSLGVTANTFGPNGFSSGSNTLVSRSKYPRS
jgi:hypothetical protein